MEEVEKLLFTDFVERIEFADTSMYQGKLVVANMHWLPIEKATFPPLRLDAFTFLLVERGELMINVDYMPIRLRENNFLVLIERHIVQPVLASEDFKGYHMLGTHDFIRSVTDDERPPMPDTANSFHSNPVICLEKAEFEILRNNIERLCWNIGRGQHAYQAKLVKNALGDLLFEIWNFTVLKSDKREIPQKIRAHEDTFARFFDLIFEHVKKEHDVAFYADVLCVTPVYLSRAVKRVTGKPAMKIISDTLLTEAKILLRNPGLTIQEIAEELHFSDQASFSKFFKKNEGESPLHYRKMIHP